MRTWSFQVKNNPKEITRKLESSLGRANRFVLNMKSDNKDLVKFKLRKRLLVTFGTTSQDQVVVNGKIFKADSASESAVEISFTQHPLMKLLLYGHIILGLGFLAGVVFQIKGNSYMFIVAGILLAIGVFFRLHHQREFDKNVQKYKTLISEILEV